MFHKSHLGEHAVSTKYGGRRPSPGLRKSDPASTDCMGRVSSGAGKRSSTRPRRCSTASSPKSSIDRQIRHNRQFPL